MRKRRHSLSGRLLLLFVFTAVVLALIVRAGFRFALDRNMEDMAAPHLAEYVQHLLDELGNPPTPAAAAILAERLPLQIHILGEPNWSSGGAMPKLNPRRTTSRVLPDGTVFEVSRGREGIAVRARRGDVTVVFVPKGFEFAEHAQLTVILTIVALLTVLLLAYHAIRRLFRPIEVIQSGVARIGLGDLEHRLNIRRRDELGELAASVNAMADDIRNMLEAKRELLLAISHELRSPLTRARVNAELLDDTVTRRALLADLGELEALLNELLESERLSGRHAALDRQAVDPSALLRELVAESFSDASLETDFDPEGTWISLDPMRVRLLVRNLLKNAIQHTEPGRPPPLLASHVDDKSWHLSVTDHGPGVAPEHLGRLTEPFYRADPSRQRASGGVGLGLYLCRIIAEAHGGNLEVASSLGKGTMVRVTLPVSVD
ncbi:MAG: HAMP domain-containing sensor histidine kinase [Sedimenticolaceae bacterium]